MITSADSEVQSIISSQGESEQRRIVNIRTDSFDLKNVEKRVWCRQIFVQLEPPAVDVIGVFDRFVQGRASLKNFHFHALSIILFSDRIIVIFVDSEL